MNFTTCSGCEQWQAHYGVDERMNAEALRFQRALDAPKHAAAISVGTALHAPSAQVDPTFHSDPRVALPPDPSTSNATRGSAGRRPVAVLQSARGRASRIVESRLPSAQRQPCGLPEPV